MAVNGLRPCSLFLQRPASAGGVEMPHGPPSLFHRIRESQQREVLHGPGEEVSADEDGADHEGPWELPELPGHEAACPTLKLWHLRHPGPQGPGVPHLCSGELMTDPKGSLWRR